MDNKLTKIHQELYPSKKIFILRPKVLILTGTAACLAIAVTIFNVFDKSNITGKVTPEIEYHELSGEHDDEIQPEDESDETEPKENDIIEKNLELTRELCDSVIVQVPDRPVGTCFMISKDGYFLTSKHLVKNKRIFIAQQRETGETFEVETVYRDSLLDFAILRCHPDVATLFNSVPFKFYNKDLELGEEVFTLGYPKSNIVYTKGDVSSETGYLSDSNFVEVSLPSNPGYSGAPLFTESGYLAGIITANNSKKQSVTYVLRHDYVFNKIEEIKIADSLKIDLSKNYSRRYSQKSNLIKSLSPFVFELHP